MKDKKVIILKMMKVDRAVDEESAKDDNSQEDRAGCSDHLLDHICICICIQLPRIRHSVRPRPLRNRNDGPLLF